LVGDGGVDGLVVVAYIGHSASWLVHHWSLVPFDTVVGLIVYCSWAETEERRVAAAREMAVMVFMLAIGMIV